MGVVNLVERANVSKTWPWQFKIFYPDRARHKYQNLLHFVLFTRESRYCFQRVLAIAILSVCPSVRHTGGSGKNGPS